MNYGEYNNKSNKVNAWKFFSVSNFFSGGWGWLVCGAAFLAYLLTSGLQFAFGLLYLYTLKFLLRKNDDKEFYVMATGKPVLVENTFIHISIKIFPLINELPGFNYVGRHTMKSCYEQLNYEQKKHYE